MIADAFGKSDNGQLLFNLSRKEIASMAGTTYENVIRMLNELVKENLIRLSEKDIYLLDEKNLGSAVLHLKPADAIFIFVALANCN